jgi:hypothetical protein
LIRVKNPQTLLEETLLKVSDSTELVEVLQTTIYSFAEQGWSQRRIARKLEINRETFFTDRSLPRSRGPDLVFGANSSVAIPLKVKWRNL